MLSPESHCCTCCCPTDVNPELFLPDCCCSCCHSLWCNTAVLVLLSARVLKTRRVADDFHCRFRARCRSYVYRLSICRQPEQKWTLAYTPMEFMHSCFVRWGSPP